MLYGMNDAAWWWAIGIAVVAAIAVGFTFARSRRGAGRDDADRDEAPVVATAEPAPVAVAPPARPPPSRPATTPAAPPASVATAPPSPPPSRAKAYEPVPVTVVPTPSRPSVPVVERVLAVAPADDGAWSSAVPLAMSPVQAAALATIVAPGSADRNRLRVRFPAGTALRLARAEAGAARALATSESSGAPPVQWLDSVAAASLASNVIAAVATAGDLGTLADECRDLKAAVAALPSKPFGPAEPRLKAVLQDASRYAREARDNYPSVIGKLAFRERVGTTFAAALDVWRDQVVRAEPLQARSRPLLSAPRFGEVQVEAALALWRDLGEWQRLLELSARLLVVLHLLRLSVGDGPAPGEGDAIASAATSLRAVADENADAATRLKAREAGAKGDPYVGRGEFEASRATLRTLLERPWHDGIERAVDRVEKAARAASPELAESILIAPAGGSCEVRLSAG